MAIDDEGLLRIAFGRAVQAREAGNHAFGAVLADADGNPLMAAGNSMVSGDDVTGHAEMNLIRAAASKWSATELRACTMYASAEPCPMCAGAIVWANVRRVVYGLGMPATYALFDTGDGPALRMHARTVFAAAPWPVTTIGPLLEDEARQVFFDSDE